MPSPPEFRDTLRYVWIVEILFKFKPEHLPQSHSHIRVSAEIKIYLERIGKNTHPCREHGQPAGWHPGDLVKHLARRIGDDHLLRESDDKEHCPLPQSPDRDLPA